MSYEENPKQEDIQILYDGLKDHMIAKRNLSPIRFFAYYIKDDDGKIVGGCNGDILYGCLYVGTLWVDASLRGKGYGTKLMQAAEQLGKDSKCNFMAVNTMDWEALDFYKKLGYSVELERKGFEKDSIFYFLRKELI